MTLPHARRRAVDTRVTQFRIGYFLLGAHFTLPAISYITAPEATVATVQQVNALLGGAASWVENSQLWHMLAVGNVMTLGFMCFLILSDVKRFVPVLPALAFLKGFSALYSLGIFLTGGLPLFGAVFLLDGSTTVLLVVLPVRALAALSPPSDPSAPWWARALLLRPEQIEQTLARISAARLVDRTPNLWQVFLGTLAMVHRVLFRSQTVGTSRAPVRDTLRARVLSWRALRLPVLLMARAIKPLELLGLSADEAMIRRHLLLAHHDEGQLTYDLQFLSLFDGGLSRLQETTRAVVDGTHPRACFIRDLCVFQGYHEGLLAAVDDALAGAPIDPRVLDDADLSLTGTLRWCARMPATPAETRRAWATLKLQFS